MPDFVTPEEGMSPVTDPSNDSGYETCGYAPADDNADQDSFQDKDRQKTLAQGLEKELYKAPWKKQPATGPIDDLKMMTKTVKPVYEGFLYNSDQDILARLDQASKKLKERRKAELQDNLEDDNAVPATPNLEKSCSLSDEPIGHHVLECSKETLQDTLKEIIHSTPVEPLTSPPKIIHQFPEVHPQTLLPPPPGILANFSVKVNSIAKMHTGRPPKEAHILAALTTQPKVMMKRMSPEEIQSHTNSA